MSGKPPVLVLGNGVTALGVIRALGAAGIQSYVLGSEDAISRRSRWYVPAPEKPEGFTMRDLSGYLADGPLDSAVLLPCSDSAAMAVADLPPELRRRFPASVTPAGSLEILTDKGSFSAFLTRESIPHPWTMVLRTTDDIALAPPTVFADAFLKPCDSQAFFKRYGRKGQRVQDADAAVRQMAEFAQTGFQMVLQEYIPGPPDHHYFVDGFVDREGNVRALFARRRLRMYPPSFGNSSLMVSVPLNEAAGAIESVERIVSRLKYRGIFSAEFKRDPRDGLFKILEVNARAWWYVEFAVRCGVDVCRMAYRDALEEPVDGIDTYAVGVPCVYPYYDYFACRELRAAGELSVLEWARSWIGSLQPVFRWSDPLPALSSSLQILAGDHRRRSPLPQPTRVAAKPDLT
ncbi:MAG: hypothetical protein GEU90_12065 [Gemmatimonas sp.]|nr:hypothetical protein [Gemmatimonas sp.]